MDKFSELKSAAMAATPGPWQWFTSNSMARLSSTPSGKDGDVLSAFRASDGVPCVSVSQYDMAFIAAANPAVVLELLAELEAKDEQNKLLMREIEHGKKLRVNMQKNADSLSERIDELEAKLATPVRLPDIRSDDYHETGWFQHMKYYRDVERSILAAGFTMGDE